VIKQLRFTRPGPGLSDRPFASAWRDAEARRIEALAPDRVALCTVRRPEPGGVHGVAIEWFAAGAKPGTGSYGPGVEAAAPSVRVEERCVQGAEWLATRGRGHRHAPALVLLGFIQAAPHLSRRDFAAYWWERHRPLADALVPAALQPVAYVHDYVIEGEASTWDGIGEMYEESLDVARRRGAWFASDDAAPLVADEQRFLVGATRQVLVADHEVIWPVAEPVDH
jgi:hypothetical protein